MSEKCWDQRSNEDVDSENANKDTGSTGAGKEASNYENFTKLEELSLRCGELFKTDLTEKGQRLYEAFNGITDHLKNAKILVEKIRSFAHEYDFDESTPGNGYRSFVIVVEAGVSHTTDLATYIENNCTKVLFRKGHYMKEIEACNHFLASICTCLEYLLILREWCTDGDLFSNGKHTVEELFQLGDVINQYCYYGRCLGIQYSPSIRGILRFISICMAGFSESYYSQANRVAKTTSSVWTGGKYFLNPEQRARRIVNISQYAEVDFCKAFWFLAEGEIMHTLPSIVGSSVKVNKVISIPPEELELENLLTGAPIKIPLPNSHLGPGPVNVRLLSASVREGMLGESSNVRNMQQPSKNLIIHCHGGGFVAQSSKSHELYLRDWTIQLDAPIVSVDYSLAPQAPFPRALEEVFYAYCWAAKNCRSLGSTGEKIIIAGDSAGANLSIGCILKCIELGIRRPDGLFMAYCPVLVDFVPSPARMLCLMDPLLPFGFMIRCLKAYACPSEAVVNANRERYEALERIKNARDSITLHTLDNSAKSSRKDSRATIISVENGLWDNISNENGITSPISDNTSDTFASASYHSQTVENTELLTPEDASSCISFEDDSQPITKMPEGDVNVMSGISNNVGNLTMEHKDAEENYVSTYLKNYIVDCESEAKANGCPTIKPSVSKTTSEENILADAYNDMISSESIQMRLNKAAEGIVGTISTKINEYTNSSEIAGSSRDQASKLKNIDSLIARSPSMEFVFQVPKDPHLSPYWAQDDILAKMPPTSVVTIDMDPCLDDCVMFAKKLKALGVPVTLDILKGLPHGFLNFTMVSCEAMKGSKECIKRLVELLNKEVA